jgi:hypothetical protein
MTEETLDPALVEALTWEAACQTMAARFLDCGVKALTAQVAEDRHPPSLELLAHQSRRQADDMALFGAYVGQVVDALEDGVVQTKGLHDGGECRCGGTCLHCRGAADPDLREHMAEQVRLECAAWDALPPEAQEQERALLELDREHDGILAGLRSVGWDGRLTKSLDDPVPERAALVQRLQEVVAERARLCALTPCHPRCQGV